MNTDQKMSGWWYLSFAAHKFLGAVVVQARGMDEAVQTAHRLKINPGGEVLGALLPPDLVPPPQHRDRLLSKSEVVAIWADA